MRDRRFVAVHRGGPLPAEHHQMLARWAADCVERLLPLFEAETSDERPRLAVETARAWAHGDVPVGAAQRAAVAAHAAAREAPSAAATALARAAGHAVATAHMADHALGVPIYTRKLFAALGQSAEPEIAWQFSHLPAGIYDLVVSGLEGKGFTHVGG